MSSVIGFLGSTPSAGFEHLTKAFCAGLGAKNDSSGGDAVILEAWAGGDYGRLGALAQSLVSQDVEVLIAAGGIVAAKAAIDAASPKNLPVLYVTGRAPSIDGLDKYSKAYGVNVDTTNLLQSRRQDLEAILGAGAKIVLMVNPRAVVASEEEKSFGSYFQASVSNLDSAFASGVEGVQGVVVSADPYFNSQRQRIVDLAAKHGVAASYPWADYVALGGLISRGPNLTRVYSRLGIMAADILTNGKSAPSDTRFLAPGSADLTINLRTARAHNRNVPDSLLLSADRLIH